MNELTLREIWDRIVATQDQLESIEKQAFYLSGIEESGSFVEVEESDSEHCGEPLPYCKEVALEKIRAVKEIATAREQTLQRLLDFYVGIFNDCRKQADQA